MTQPNKPVSQRAIYVQWSDDGQRIWSHSYQPFEGATKYLPAETLASEGEADPIMQEIADGAWGDGPRVRGQARDLLASAPSQSDVIEKCARVAETVGHEWDSLAPEMKVLTNRIAAAIRALASKEGQL